MLPTENRLIGKMNYGIDRIYPKLEDLEVIPTGQDQHFKSEEYGYDNVTVKAVESEELNIMPNTEEQEYVGMFKKVTVPGDSDLAPENIADGKEIFGVKGSAKIADFVITDGYNLCAYGHRQKNAQAFVNLCGQLTTMYGMFNSCGEITDLDVSKLDTSQVTSMRDTFSNCRKVTKLDVSNFDTSQCTDMYCLFNQCQKVTELDVSNFDNSKVTNRDSMFSGVPVTKLDVSSFDTSNVTDMSSMFRSVKVTELDLSNFDTSQCTNMSYMLADLQLTNLDISNFDMSKIISVNSMFSNTYYLINLKSFKNLGKGYTRETNNYSNYSLQLHNIRSQLTTESLIDIITNGLYDLNLTYDVANGGTLYTQSLKLGSTHLAKLEATEEGQQALALAAAKRLDCFVERRKNLWN